MTIFINHDIACGERDFVVVIKLRILKPEGYPGISGWAQCIPKGPKSQSQRRKCHDGGRGWNHVRKDPGAKENRQPLEAAQGKEKILSLSLH